jgi:Flp pilus assembly pilin Flp
MKFVEFRSLRQQSSSVAKPRRQALVEETDGAVFVEYLTLTLLVAVLCAAATATLGVPLLRLFRFQQAVVAVPIP